MNEKKNPSLANNREEEILEEFSDGVFAIDNDWRIISFSKGAERITGYLAIDITGKNFNKVFKSKLDIGKSLISDGLKYGRSLTNITLKIENAENKSITISINATPLKDVKGNNIGLIVNFRDVEEVYKLHADLYTENTRLISILNSITDGVLTVDNEWRITSFNPAAERITGHRAENVMGKQCYDVMQSETCKTNCPLRKTMTTKMPIYDYEIEIINAQGKVVPVSVNTALLIDEQNSIIGGVETFRDLSIFKKLTEELHNKYSYEKIIGKDKKMQKVYNLLETISPINTTVLITGETGTGKELVACAIHHNSPRKHKPFIKIDCSAIPETLIESELFGYMKGAFTDARADKPGKFQLADKGTIFLDEISNIPLSVQAKLLRVIEEQAFEPLGGVKTIRVDVRIIAATNIDLQKSIAQATFRQDLYYRINVVLVTLPPLRARSGDIPLLVSHFITLFNEKFGKAISRLSQNAMDVLLDYPWPGNVRQLEHAIEHAFIHCTGRTIHVNHLPDDINHSNGVLKPTLMINKNPLLKMEQDVIVKTLHQNKGNRRKTANALGISRITLWRKMKKHQITSE